MTKIRGAAENVHFYLFNARCIVEILGNNFCKISIHPTLEVGSCGGSKGGKSSFEFYNPTAAKWKRLKSMQVARRSFKMASFGGLIYAFGGEDGNGKRLNSVECYFPEEDRWELANPMPFISSDFSLAFGT